MDLDQVTKATYDTFLTDVLGKLPVERRTEIEASLRDPVVAPLLREAVLAKADYSRSMNDFQAEVTAARAEIAKWQDWYSTEVEQATKRQEELDSYRETYGDLDEEGKKVTKRAEPAHTGLDPKQLEATLAQRDQMAIQFADMLTDLKLDHHTRFGERLDTQAVMKYANDHQVSLKEAYNQLNAPKEQELATRELNKKLEAAREEGRQAVLSEHKLPIGPPRREPHFLEQKDYSKDPRERVSRAVAAFNAGLAR